MEYIYIPVITPTPVYIMPSFCLVSLELSNMQYALVNKETKKEQGQKKLKEQKIELLRRKKKGGTPVALRTHPVYAPETPCPAKAK